MDLLYGIRILKEVSFDLSQFTRLTGRQTDISLMAKTAFYIQCSTVQRALYWTFYDSGDKISLDANNMSSFCMLSSTYARCHYQLYCHTIIYFAFSHNYLFCLKIIYVYSTLRIDIVRTGVAD